MKLDMGTCGDGIRGKEGGERGLFRNLGGQMDKLCGRLAVRKDEQGMCVCVCAVPLTPHHTELGAPSPFPGGS